MASVVNMRSILFTLFLFGPVALFCGIVGSYKVEGFDPQTNSKYTGTLVITKSGNVYSATWNFNGNTDTATGVRRGDSVAFVFREGNSNSYGVQLYEIEENRLKGPWVRFGATSRGFERAKKVKKIQGPI